MPGNDDMRNIERARHLACEKTTAAAEREQCKIARVVALSNQRLSGDIGLIIAGHVRIPSAASSVERPSCSAIGAIALLRQLGPPVSSHRPRTGSGR